MLLDFLSMVALLMLTLLLAESIAARILLPCLPRRRVAFALVALRDETMKDWSLSQAPRAGRCQHIAPLGQPGHSRDGCPLRCLPDF
jgi:hypothetical protein